jgi:mannose-1-phosphate guanylyltransferase/phosphomannomutase
MAGGEGTRLRPLTCGLPKPMIPVGNKPILDHVLTLLARHGFREVLLTLHHRPRAIRDHVGDGEAFGLRTRCYVEDVPSGTAGSVKNIQAELDGPFIVISGDVLTDFDLTALVDFHRRRGAALTVGLTQVGAPLEYGVVVCDRDGRIARFIEKPLWNEVISDQVNTGIYVVEPEVLDFVAPGRASDFSRHLFPALMKAGKPLFGYRGEGYWCDVGTPGQYLQAHIDLLEGRINLDIDGTQFEDKIWTGSGVDIAPEVELTGPLLIGPGTYLGRGAKVIGPAVLGREVVIGGQASVKRSIVGDYSFVGRLAEVRGAILGRSVRLNNRSSVFDGAVLADEVRVGEEATIKPGIKIWPGRAVAPETVLGHSLVWGHGWGYGVFGEAGVSGQVNVDLRPEMAAKLGAVFGASLPVGAAVLVGADPAIPARLLREAVVSGLGLSGCAVVSAGELPACVIRFAVRAMGAAGGVHIGAGASSIRDTGGPGYCAIGFYDDRGFDLDRQATRRLERGIGDEDFRRAAPERLSEVRCLPGLGEAYLTQIIERGRGLARKGLVVAGAYRHAWLRRRADEIWRALDVGHVILEPFAAIAAAGGPHGLMPGLTRQLEESGASFAFEIDLRGENLTLVDNRGRLLTPAQTWLVLSSVAIAREETPVVVPSDLPRALGDRLAALGGRPILSRSSRAELQARMGAAEETLGASLFRQSEMTGDALLAVVGLLDYLSDTEETVAEMVDRSPLGEWVHLRVPCSWEVKGRVMRLLLEDADVAAGGLETGRDGRIAEPAEGLRVEATDGRVLVLPDADRPAFHVYSEAVSMEAAEELAGSFAQRVRRLAGLTTDTGIPSPGGQS